MIYVIGSEHCWLRHGQSPYVKIGTTIDLRQRVAKMQTDFPHKILVYYVFNGGEDRERELHEMFRPWHYRGEWFRTWIQEDKMWFSLKGDLDAEWDEEEAPLVMARRGVVT